jgi:DedD protein
LIGASVLVVLAVIFVPMLIDDRPRSDSEAIDLAIPAQPNQAFETQVVPLGPVATPPAPAAAANPDAVTTVDTIDAPRVDVLAGQEPPVMVTPTTMIPTPPPAGNSPAAPASAVAAADTATPAAALAAPASAPPRAPGLPQPSVGGRYVVLFGSYARTENAQALTAELARAGIRAETERVEFEGKPALRVRSGPYAERTAAERIRLAARQARPDVTSSLVEADVPSRADAQQADTGSRVTGWAVQVGALAEAADANALRDRLRAGGLTAYVETLRTERGTLYRVRVGPEIQRASAERLRDSLKSRFGLDGQVVAHP